MCITPPGAKHGFCSVVLFKHTVDQNYRNRNYAFKCHQINSFLRSLSDLPNIKSRPKSNSSMYRHTLHINMPFLKSKTKSNQKNLIIRLNNTISTGRSPQKQKGEQEQASLRRAGEGLGA